ncbi:hypothetical protein H114_00777 [Streptomyces gancidicus BKS 13-15]|uniref:Uncharacterized protein n=1 Tax=Streptomyces gancidicus BKS 13-15 TaxID=1284664 RepID=M3D405_STREZ|nr:hypothetical protein [Streptomyces gancidicus]EMF31118.1 hypothetical protein H114_00777 [Streptomyces gancidicus BKS 13-15]
MTTPDTTSDPAQHADTRRRVNVTLTFATDRPTADVGVAVTTAAGLAVPGLDGVTWHAFTLPADDEQER